MSQPSAERFDPSDPLWAEPLFGAGADGFAPDAFVAMEACATALDWPGYLALARQAKKLLPRRPPSRAPTSDALASLAFHEALIPRSPLQLALASAPDDASRDAILATLRPHLPPATLALVLDHLLMVERDPAVSMVSGTDLLRAALRAGADPAPAAALAARTGDVEGLRAILDHGVSPDERAPGRMPLIMEALCKDPRHKPVGKMACARMLWERGASLEKAFGAGAGATCLLDLAIAPIDSAWPGGAAARADPRWAGFRFPWNDFESSGIPAWALLPPESNREANAMLAGLARADGHAGEPDANPNPWIQFAQAYPLLGVALEIAELRMSPHAPPSSRRKAI